MLQNNANVASQINDYNFREKVNNIFEMKQIMMTILNDNVTNLRDVAKQCKCH